MKSNYDKYPTTIIKNCNTARSGYASILEEIQAALKKRNMIKTVITLECYPGTREYELLDGLIYPMRPALILHADDAALSGDAITKKMQPYLTDDRVFGYLYPFNLKEFYIPELILKMQEKINIIEKGVIFIYGFGASLITTGDYLLYANLARWEIQQRYRSNEIGNWKADNLTEDLLKKYKRGYFLEWRMADRIKKELYERIDYLLDVNTRNEPKMVAGEAFREGLRQVTKQPFRLVPYFDPGVWGGQWMKEVCGLDRSEDNFAWSFDGVPEENSLYLQYGSVTLEVPAIDAVLYKPVSLLGDRVYGRFGPEFPIRFDFLDTMGGGNLSLQVHPLTEYIQQAFGMHYTQDESYYLLDAEEGAVVYLGLKENVDKVAFLNDLRRAQTGEISFPDETYINRFPAKKHDHFLIPAGTIHCSGRNSMVLEISSTPYIFTFKLWDWDRLGLDGIPRPVHIDHGEKVIQWDRTTAWVKNNLLPRNEIIAQGDGWREERTGLHEREFIETRRCWITSQINWHTENNVNMLNLVEGEEAVIESPDNSFAPFVVHYAETFIIPAAVGAYSIRPHGLSMGREIAVIKAYIRN